MTNNQKNDSMMQQVDSQYRRTYAPNYAWADVMGAYTMIPGLRGFWPMSTVDYQGNAFDFSEISQTLTYAGNPTYNLQGLAPYIDLDGTGDYLFRNDRADLDILGTETYIAPALQGMTVGGWFYFDVLGSVDILMAKSDLGAQQSFLLSKSVLDVISFSTYAAGGGGGAATVGANTVAATNWYFIVGRFDTTANEMDLFTDDAIENLAAGVPAAIFNSTAQFTIGASSGGTFPLNGRATLCFYTAAALPTSYILSLFHISRALFGK